MERPTSEKVALLERVLNRIRENARDAGGRSRFVRGGPEPKTGASAARPSAPPPTLAFPAEQLPDATPIAAAAASPPPPPVAAAASPAPPAVDLSLPADFEASFPVAPVAPAALAKLAAAQQDDNDDVPSSGPTQLVMRPDLAAYEAELAQSNQPNQPAQPRATQSLFEQRPLDDVHVDVAFDEDQAGEAAHPPSAPPQSPFAPPAVEANDVTGVRPIAPAPPGEPRFVPTGGFGAAPFEVDLASTIELPAADLASAVHSSSAEERPAPASSPRLRSSPAVDEDTYPAVSPSSLPPPHAYEAGAGAAPEPSPTESQVGMRAPSAAPAPYHEGRVPSELPPPPLRRSEMPRPVPASLYTDSESVEQPAPRMVVAPAPAALASPERPPPAPLGAISLEADAFARPAPQGNAANFVTAVRGPAPRTFGELLDASLALGGDL